MSELRFDFMEVHQEIINFIGFAKTFLDNSAETCLQRFAADLLNIRSHAPLASNRTAVVNRATEWKIMAATPLLTKASDQYEGRGRKTAREIIGQLTAVWGITPDPKNYKSDVPKQFRITGNASVKVQWLNAADLQVVGCWNVDVADDKAPGCMFHVQFPSGIPVPRMPSIAFTPLAVAEHMLGELFQDDWVDHSRRPSAPMQGWSYTQKKRLLRILEWHKKVVDKCTVGPPWTALKKDRMPQDHLVTP
jgi:hypothetical protein